jgi:hypothetical protein
MTDKFGIIHKYDDADENTEVIRSQTILMSNYLYSKLKNDLNFYDKELIIKLAEEISNEKD